MCQCGYPALFLEAGLWGAPLKHEAWSAASSSGRHPGLRGDGRASISGINWFMKPLCLEEAEPHLSSWLKPAL